MRFAVLVFGALGFALVAVAGFSAERAPDLVLRDAALACLAMALAGRWFWGVVDRAFAETVIARRAAAIAEAAAAEATPAAPFPNKSSAVRGALPPKPATSAR
jgi:hypothetical protein